MIGLLHRIAAIPWVYDLIQYIFGAPITYGKLRRLVQLYPAPTTILDIGGGTGIIWRNVLQDVFSNANYACLDNDTVKLSKLQTAAPGKNGVLGDAAKLPVADGSVDCAIMMAVTHHIPSEQLPSVIEEAFRVIHKDGILLFLDAVDNPNRLLSKLLWRLDRGSFPKTQELLRETLVKYGEPLYHERFSILYQYVVYVMRPRHDSIGNS